MKNSLFDEFRRVAKTARCPVCGKSDWCLVSRDNTESPSRAICKRVKSDRPWGEAGFLHELRLHFYQLRSRRHGFALDLHDPASGGFESVAAWASHGTDPFKITLLSRLLSVTPESLTNLGAGWMTSESIVQQGTRSKRAAWSFPMRDHFGRVCGIRLRTSDGCKFALAGSRNGLFIPRRPLGPIDRVLIAEGESDAAALLDLGFCAIGKPGAGNADDLTVRYLQNVRPREIVVVADNDEIGRKQAKALGRRLAVDHRQVRVLVPPAGIKDARAWKLAGADMTTIETVIAATSPVCLTLTSTRRGA